MMKGVRHPLPPVKRPSRRTSPFARRCIEAREALGASVQEVIVLHSSPHKTEWSPFTSFHDRKASYANTCVEALNRAKTCFFNTSEEPRSARFQYQLKPLTLPSPKGETAPLFIREGIALNKITLGEETSSIRQTVTYPQGLLILSSLYVFPCEVREGSLRIS